MKTCSTCSTKQSLESFYKDKKSPSGLRAQCKTCVKLAKRKYFENNRDRELQKLKDWKIKNPDKVKAGNIRNLYGLDDIKYKNMIMEQDNCCAICNKSQLENVVDVRNNKPRDLSVDHNHVTGVIRGLLCYHCNLAVGMLKDQLVIAERLVEYLRKHEEKAKV